MKKANGFCSSRGVAELDKREPSFPARFAVHRNEYVQNISRGGEMGTNFLFGRVVGKIPDKKTNRHFYLVKALIGEWASLRISHG